MRLVFRGAAIGVEKLVDAELYFAKESTDGIEFFAVFVSFLGEGLVRGEGFFVFNKELFVFNKELLVSLQRDCFG